MAMRTLKGVDFFLKMIVNIFVYAVELSIITINEIVFGIDDGTAAFDFKSIFGGVVKVKPGNVIHKSI